MSWTNETKIAFTIFLCAALIGTAVMIREAGITGLATKDNANLPPKWIGKTNKYVVEQNSPLMLNLAELFSDPEGQTLAFVATEAKDLSIALDGNQLTIVPQQGFVGERIVTVYASDGEKASHKKIKIEVRASQSLPEDIQPSAESYTIPESEPTNQPEQSSPDAGIQDGGGIAVTCTSCGDCTACAATPGNTCVLTTSISSSTTCITIGNDNVTINCDGKTITFNTGGGGNDYGITSDSRRNLTIANCTIISAQASVSAVPLNLYRTNSSRIINNTIKALSTNGIDVRSSFYNVITSNKVNATNLNGNAGIKLRQTSAHNNVTSNLVLTNGSTSENVGILADFESPNNTIANNFVVTGGSSTSNYGINAEVGDTKIINNSINTTGESVNHGIRLNGVTNSIVANNSILATGISLAQSGIYVKNTVQNVFINNNIRTVGSTNNHGIYVDAGGDRNVFLQNTISGNGTNTFAIYIESGVSGSNFSSTVINNTPHWIYTGAGTSSNFSNTTFMMPDGSINILPLIQLNSSQNISKEWLNISSNKAFLNSTNLTYFNTSAIITLYGVSFSDPKPMVDYEDDGTYEDCPPSQCSELSPPGSVFVFNTTHFTSYKAAESGIAITGCPVTINTSTTLTQDLVSNDTCITIGNDSVVLDCAGYSISYNANGSNNEFGIVASKRQNITIKNCIIKDINATGAYGIGINFSNVSGGAILNNTIITNGTQFSAGISIIAKSEDWSRNAHQILGNNIKTFGGTENHGILLNWTDGSNITNNTIITTGAGSHGMLHQQGSDDYINNTITSYEGHGIYSIASSNTFNENFISAPQGYGIFMQDGGTSTAENNTINDSAEWIYATLSGESVFTLSRTRFMQPNGSVRIDGPSQIWFSDNITKAKINISYNRAFVNSSSLSNDWNTSGEITLNGLAYSDPKPVVDYEDDGTYEDCPPSQCSELSPPGSVFVFNTTHFTSYAADETGGGTCGTCLECSSCASTPGASCAVTADLGTSGSCITIGASNVVLDCQGHTIVFDKWGMGKASGIMSKDTQNVTVKNCNIMTNHSNGNENFGINFTNSSGFRIINNSVFINTTSNNRGISIGMYGVGDSCDGIVENNTVVSLGTGSNNVGLFLASACNSNITGNTIIANGTFMSSGISLLASIGLLFSHNNISVIGDISSYAVTISDCLFSVFNATILNDSSNWIVCGGMSIDNNFTNTTFATRYGSINILPMFNLTENVYVARENLNISNNRAFLNSTALPFLNLSGIVTLENITYSHPRPLVDWNDDYLYEPCPADVCSELDHAGTRYVFNVTHFTGYSSDETGTSCPLTIYQSTTLANDLSSLTSCITFGNDSIYLDCNGHTIYYNNGSGSDDKGIIAIGRENITIRNCIIKDPTSGGMNNYAIYLEKVNSSIVVNNTMYSNCTTSCNGMVLRNSSRGNVVANNTIITLNQVSYNVEVDNSSTNAILGNTMIANSSGNMQIGIRLRDSHSSNISYNNISISGNSDNVCIELRNAENNSIENNTINNYGIGDKNYGILLWENSSNNSVVENAIRSSSTGNAIMMDHAGANVFISNWLRGGSSGYALWIEGSSFSSFYKTIINESTHFIYVNNTEHNNFTNTTFDNIIARVNFPWLLQFNGTQNLSAGKLQLSPNRVFLNSTNLSFMNTTAIITLKEIVFIDPEPAVDYDDDGSYVPCPVDVCTELGHTGGIYVFNVSRFTSYSTRETGILNITGCPITINTSARLVNDLTFTSSGNCITLNADNITLDCEGHNITRLAKGSNTSAVYAHGRLNVTVKNCNIKHINDPDDGYFYGTYFNYTNSSSVLNNTVIINNKAIGLFLSVNNSAVYVVGNDNIIGNNTLNCNSHTDGILNSTLYCLQIAGRRNNISNNEISTNVEPSPTLNHVAIYVVGRSVADNNNTFANNRISATGITYRINDGMIVEAMDTKLYNNTFSGSSAAMLNLKNKTIANITIINSTGEAWIYSTSASQFENTTFIMSSGSINILPIVSIPAGSRVLNKSHLNISANKAFLNSSSRNEWNTSGIITLYGITAISPVPIVDYEDDGSYINCPSDVCTVLDPSSAAYKFNVSHFTSFSTKDTKINSCPVTINESTTLSGNLSSNASCITIGANNVVLDCNGSTITFGVSSTPQSAGIKADTRINVTIGNCTIILGNSSARFAQGINIISGGNVTIVNNIIIVNGTGNNTGIQLFYPAYDRIQYNTIMVHGSQTDNYGIRFHSSYYNNIIGNNVSVNGTTNNVALYLAGFSYGNVSANNATAKGTLGNNYGMYFTDVSNANTIERNCITVYGDGSSDYGIRLYNLAQHNNITGNTIVTGGPGSGHHGIMLQSVNNNRLLFNNVTTTGPNSYGAYVQNGLYNRFNSTTFNTTQWVYSDSASTTYFWNTTFVRGYGSVLLNSFTLSASIFNITESVINITNNRAFVNTSKYSSLNSSGIVSLNNISFIDPSPIVDWNDDGTYDYCPPSKCAELGHEGDVFRYNVTHFTSYSSLESASIITGCPVSINESSWLANDVSTTGGCIIFNANNIELECRGNTITYNTDGVGSDAGISASGKRNITVKNCRIVLGNQGASNSPAIYAPYTNHSSFLNNTIIIDGNENNRGIWLENRSNHNRILQNDISTRGNYSHGIFVYLSTNNTIQGNVVSAGGITESSGIYLTQSWSNAVHDNNITTNGTDVYNHGIILDYYAQNNSVERNNVELFGDGGSNYGIYLVTSSSNNNITANNVKAHASLIGNYPLVIQSDSVNNRFSFNNLTGSNEEFYAVYVQLSSGQVFNNTLINNTRSWCYFDDASPSSFTNTTFETSSGSINLFVFNVSDGVGLDLTDAGLRITPNRAFLNSSAFEDLNRSGIVTLYNVVFAKPKPLVDFEDDGSYVDCPESICTELSHSGSTYSYVVAHFTSYSSSEEFPVTLSKSDRPDPVVASGLLNYTISIYANRTVANVTLTDVYPLQVVYVSSQPVPVLGTNNTWVIGNLTAGENRTVNITVRVLEIMNNTVINNTANVTLQNATGGWDNASVEEATTVINYRIINSNITNSTITNCTIINSTIIDSTKQDCVIINSIIIGSNNSNSTIIDSNETNSTDDNTYVSDSYLYYAVKTDSIINASNITNSNVTNVTLTYCIVENSTLYNVVNSSCNYTNVRQEPPVPPPQPYQPQGGSAGKGYEIPRWPPPAPLPGQACVENWACEEWSRCEKGKQRRICVDLNNCNTTKYLPLTERACGLEQIQELPAEEQPEILRPEKPIMPLPEFVAGATVVSPVVIDAVLVVLALIAIISLIIGSEKRSNIMLRVITVLLMLAGFAGIAWNYIAGEGLLLFQAISLLVIVVVLVIVWLVDYRKSGRKAVLETAPSPGLPEGVEHIGETLPEPALQSMPAEVRVEEKPSRVIEPAKPKELKIYVTHPEPKQWRMEKGAVFKPVLPEKAEGRKVYVMHAEPLQKRIVREKPPKAYRPVLEKVAELKPESDAGPMDIESVLKRSKKTLRKVHKTLKKLKKKK